MFFGFYHGHHFIMDICGSDSFSMGRDNGINRMKEKRLLNPVNPVILSKYFSTSFRQ